ncbi:MAG TPA: hypothetical protein VHC63_15315 [Acidimicrobiales bacterium]|nr:hypothetical protein [Acidimicrobiales bacterium]
MASCPELWEQLSAAENRRDRSGHRGFLAEDVVVHVQGGAELGGVDAYCLMIDGFCGLSPDYSADVERRLDALVAELDELVADSDRLARHLGVKRAPSGAAPACASAITNAATPPP